MGVCCGVMQPNQVKTNLKLGPPMNIALFISSMLLVIVNECIHLSIYQKRSKTCRYVI